MAIGNPLARLLLEPQKTAVTRSARDSPTRRAVPWAADSARANNRAQTAARTSNRAGGMRCQMPAVMPWLNAE